MSEGKIMENIIIGHHEMHHENNREESNIIENNNIPINESDGDSHEHHEIEQTEEEYNEK